MKLHVKKGMSVLQAQIDAGLSPDAFCGGHGKCGKCKIILDGKTVLACQTVAEQDMTVEVDLPSKVRNQILEEVETGDKKATDFYPGPLPADVQHPMLAAVDIGSTSLVLYLMDGRTGQQIGVKSALNPQRTYGADVVSRCSYAMEHSREALSGCIRNAVNDMIHSLCQECHRQAEEIVRITMVGNSGMHHLFLEIDTKSLALAPYIPAVLERQSLPAAKYGLTIYPGAELIWLPLIGGFVGADTVGCLVASDMDTNDQMTLMIDIGTNGEMVLGNQKRMLACSTAAGPAFEGAKITCGMRGSEGAIDKVTIKDGKLSYHVIGEGDPKGICGSGLLDAAACLLDLGLIDDTGRMEEPYYFTDQVFLNQKDVRELQLAKAAIAAGITILCGKMGIKTEQIERLLIAGAFGNYLDPRSACRIGMLPPVLLEKIQPVGNAAGKGAILAVCNEKQLERSSHLARETEFLELALDPDFQDIYVDELSFE